MKVKISTKHRVLHVLRSYDAKGASKQFRAKKIAPQLRVVPSFK